MTYADAYKKAFPYSRSKNRKSLSDMGKAYYEWYRDNYANDANMAMEAAGHSIERTLQKMSDLMEAKVTKTVTQTKVMEEGDKANPKLRPYDCKSLMDVDDNTTQARITIAMAEAFNIIGKDKGEEVGDNFIVLEVPAIRKPEGSFMGKAE